jgi:magnesium transporter
MRELMRLNDNQLKKQLSKMHAYDIANLIKDSSSDIQMRFSKLMSLSKMVDVFIELPNDVSKNYFNLLNENQKKQFLTGFEMDELKIFINSFDEDYQSYLISLLSQRKQATLKTLMSYDKEAIASIMTTEFLTINNNLSIKDATSFVIENVKDNDFIDDVFVIDSNNKLLGSISLKDLISARPSDSLESITYKTNNYLTLDDSIYQGFIKFKNYGKSVLPILNNELNIIGIITADDVLNEMILEHEEDIEK